MKNKFPGLVALLTLSVSSFAFASPANELSLPVKLGTVKEVFSQPVAGSDRLIVQIQDAHCNYEAQKNLAAILEYLIKEKKLKLIMVEGGSGDVSLSFLRSYSDQTTRKAVAEKYLKQGQISGEEYLDIVSDYDIELYGVEDEKLYDDNLSAFLLLESKRQQGLEELGRIRSLITSLKSKVYNPQLLQFEQARQKYDAKQMTLADYCVVLKARAQDRRIDLSGTHLDKYVQSVQLEKRIDFKASERQRNDFIRELGAALDPVSVKQLIEKTKMFKEGGLSAAQYYSFLREKAQGKIAMGLKYPQLASYIEYVLAGSDLDIAQFMKEIDSVERRISASLFANEDEKSLASVSDQADLVSKFLTLDLTPEEYTAIKSSPDNYKTSSWIPALSRLAANFAMPAPAASAVIDGNFAELQRFYTLGQDREKSFIKNINNKMQMSGQKIAVLITGGFHTSGVSRLLRDSGYSYAVVTPLITQKSDPSVYFSILRGEQRGPDYETIEDSEDLE